MRSHAVYTRPGIVHMIGGMRFGRQLESKSHSGSSFGAERGFMRGQHWVLHHVKQLGASIKRQWRRILLGVSLLAALIGGLALWRASTNAEPKAFVLRAEVPIDSPGFALALYQSLGARMQAGHRVRLLENGSLFDALTDDVERARSSVNIVMYIWEKGAASERLSRALIARSKAGVRCRVLVDAFGSSGFEDGAGKPLSAAGCEVRVFRPLPGQDKLARNHRKIVVIDGKVAFTGGFGVRDDWLGDGVHAESWRDEHVRFVGPTVAEAQQAFAENWQEAGGPLLPSDAFPALERAGASSAAFVSSTASPNVTRSERLTQLMIAAAKKRVWIANAYFVPSKAILELIGRKAAAGVDVRILAPGKKSDSKTSFGAQHIEYGELIERGVRVWEYLPSMMHAKTILVDDHLASIGSANLDPLSLNKLEEGTLVVDDPSVAAQLASSFVRDCAHAKEHHKK